MAGNPARPKGTPNRSTVDAREVRRRIVESWGRVNGDAQLDRLAVEDFPAYVRTVVGLLPKTDPPTTHTEWREQAETAIAEYVSACESRAVLVVLCIMAGLPREARDELLRRFLDGVDAMDLPEERIAEVVEDVRGFIGSVEEVDIEPDEPETTASQRSLSPCT